MNPSTPPNKIGCASKNETHRQAYIRILQESVDALSGDTESERDAILSGELILGQFLDGDVNRDGNGVVSGSTTRGVTVAGRLFLQQLKKEERDESRFGLFKRYGLVVFGFIMGIAANVLPDFIKHLFHNP